MRGYSFAKNLSKFAAGAMAFRKGTKPKSGKIVKKNQKRYKRRRVSRFKRKRGGSVKLRGDDYHSGISSNWINVMVNKPLRGKTASRFCLLQNYSGYMTDYAGNQGHKYLVGLCALNQFTTSVATPNGAQVRVPFFELDPSATNTGSNFVGSVLQPKVQRLAVYNARVNMMLTNFESVATTVVLYVVTPKVNTGKSAEDAWQDGYTSAAFGKVARSRDAAGGYGTTTAGAGSPNDLYAKPTDSVLFNKQYKILKIHKMQLAAAATEEVNIHVKINKVVRRDWLEDLNIENIKGLNVQIFAVWYGQPVTDKTVGGVSSNVTSSTTNIGFITTVKYSFGSLKTTVPAANDFFSNNQLAYGTAIGDQKVVNILDAVSAVVQNV